MTRREVSHKSTMQRYVIKRWRPLWRLFLDSVNIRSLNLISHHCASFLLALLSIRRSMRLPSFPTIVRTFYTLSNSTARALPASQKALAPFTRSTVIKSMPTIPFLSSFFSTSSSSKDMSYPVQKSDDEWQAVLNPGTPNSTHAMPTTIDSC